MHNQLGYFHKSKNFNWKTKIKKSSGLGSNKTKQKMNLSTVKHLITVLLANVSLGKDIQSVVVCVST